MTIKEIIEINEIKLQTINNLIGKTKDEVELYKYHSCRRFIKGFIDELKTVK